MADKKPTDLIKVFVSDKYSIEEEINEWLEKKSRILFSSDETYKRR